MSKTTGELFDMARSAVAKGSATAGRVIQDVREALKINLGTVLFSTYESHVSQGWTPDKAKKLTMQLALDQLEQKIADSKKAGTSNA